MKKGGLYLIGFFLGALVIITVVWKLDTTYAHPRPVSLVDADSIARAQDSLSRRDRALRFGDSLVNHARQFIGTCYIYGGKNEHGFDCSGFVYFIFKDFDIDVPVSSKYYDTLGIQVPLEQARKGDIVVFTGTNHAIREPGHVGIIINEPGEPVQFIHSSSARNDSGVKISNLSDGNYPTRFMQIRRVIE